MIRPLWLDYQRPDPGSRRPGLLALGLGLLGSGLLLGQYFTLVGEVDDLEQQVSRLKRKTVRQLPTETAGDTAGRSGTGAGTHSAAQWEELFTSLEEAGNDSVTLLTLQPGASEITISGEAKDLAASMEYVKRLQSCSVFAGVHLTQSEIVLGHPLRPIRFALAAEWRGAAS